MFYYKHILVFRLRMLACVISMQLKQEPSLKEQKKTSYQAFAVTFKSNLFSWKTRMCSILI